MPGVWKEPARGASRRVRSPGGRDSIATAPPARYRPCAPWVPNKCHLSGGWWAAGPARAARAAGSATHPAPALPRSAPPLPAASPGTPKEEKFKGKKPSGVWGVEILQLRSASAASTHVRPAGLGARKHPRLPLFVLSWVSPHIRKGIFSPSPQHKDKACTGWVLPGRWGQRGEVGGGSGWHRWCPGADKEWE